MKKRLLAMLMVLSMALSILPMSAMAAPDDGSGGQDETSQVVNPGGTVYYDQNGKQYDTGKLGEDGIVVEMSKTVQAGDSENIFDVTLQVKTNQNVQELSSTNPDAAVALVLDLSGSMEDCVECGKGETSHSIWSDHTYKSRLAQAQENAIQFLNQFSELSSGEGKAKRMVTVITFNSHAQRVTSWLDVTNQRNLNYVQTQINSLEISERYTGTNIEAGLMLADNNLDEVKEEGIEYLYTILLTDGKPTWHVQRTSNSKSNITGERGGGISTQKEDAEDVGKEANDILTKSRNSKLFSICFGVEKVDWSTVPVWETTPFKNWYNATPPTTERTTVGQWLTSFSSKAYNGGTKGENLFDNFDSILSQIEVATKAFKVTDEMGENVSVVNYQQNEGNTVKVSENRDQIYWDILQSALDSEESNYTENEDGTITGTLAYTLHYYGQAG